MEIRDNVFTFSNSVNMIFVEYGLFKFDLDLFEEILFRSCYILTL